MSQLHNYLRILILPLKEIDEATPKSGKIVELGCGEGVISRFLAKEPNRDISGIDLNSKRLPKISAKNLRFKKADIRKYKLGNLNGVVISDVLHHLEKKDQKALIKNIYKGLKNNGVLIIKEIDTAETIRSALSRFWDFLLYPKDKISYWDNKELSRFLTKLGFRVLLKRTNRLFPGSTTLFIATK